MKMKAIFVDRQSYSESMEIRQMEIPRPGPGQLLVKVKAAGVNRADILQRQSHYPPPPGESDILGLEISGVIEQTGTQCDGWESGDPVFGLLAGGGYAEYALLDQGMAMKKPGKFSFEEAAAIPEAFLTAYQALRWSGRVASGEWVLVHAGASGVGSAAIQLAGTLGASVLATAGTESKAVACLNWGAEKCILYKKMNFLGPVMESTAGRGVDLILDFVGQSFWEQNLAALATDGRMVILATLGGSILPNFDLRSLMKKRLMLTGTTLRNRSLSYKVKLTTEFWKYSRPLFQTGRLQAAVDKIFHWREAGTAHRYMEENRNIGKIVLRISDE